MARVRGFKHMQGTKEKISKTLKGHFVSEETRQKLRECNLGNIHSEETRKKISLIMRGVNVGCKSYLWKGGISSINQIARNSWMYRNWRISVFKRDSYTCVWCGARNGKGMGETVVLNADHIKSFANFPELRFELDNGRTLCVPCHKTTDTWRRPPKGK